MVAKLIAFVTLALVLDVVPSCGMRKPRPMLAPEPPTAASAIDGPRADVSGTVKLDGAPPEMPEQKRGVDPVCAKQPMREEEVLVDTAGNLANVLVRITNGPPHAPASNDRKVTITQSGCRYTPRVVPLVLGQKLAIHNGDPTLHNVRATLTTGTSETFNATQIPNAPDVDRTFGAAKLNTMQRLRCDVHQWMTAYVWVQDNSLFAVTDEHGAFTLHDVPVGTYDVEAWHERYGIKKAKLTVADQQVATLNFTYVPSDTLAPR